jgi:hypothetical protein
MEWSIEELALLARHSNPVVSELTGRSVEEVAERRLQRISKSTAGTNSIRSVKHETRQY